MFKRRKKKQKKTSCNKFSTDIAKKNSRQTDLFK